MAAPAVLLEWRPETVQAQRRRRPRWRFPAVVLTAFLAAAALPAAAVTDVMRWSAVDDRTATDAIVVLGAAQYQGTPSPVLANRLAHARTLVDAGVAETVITVGGFQFGDITSEAQAGKEELVADGMESRDVIAIPFGTDTRESIQAVATIAAAQGIQTVTLVTDPAHEARTLALAKQFGLDARVSPTVEGAGSSLTAQYVARESLGLINVWLDR